MDTPPERQFERILLLDGHVSDIGDFAREIVERVPDAEIVPVHSYDEYSRAVAGSEFDIVVLDYDLPEVQSRQVLAELKLREYEPDVLLVSSCDAPELIRSIAGARRRYVVRDEHVIDSLALALRDMLRIRRLEGEMARIRAKLTETNSMLEEKNRRLDEFCSTIAHDIRGPLAGLMLKLEYVMDAYEESLEGRCYDILRKSLDSAERLVGIVQAMYEFAKLGSRAAELVPLELQTLITEVVGDLSYDESLDIRIGIGELPIIWGNVGLLRRVFMNLITNAIKYNDKSPIVINIGYDGDVSRTIAKFARIYVEDNGPGINDEDLKHIFNMFKRGTRSPGQPEGLGIGLAVVHRIVELHYGKIEVVSEVGKGTRFTVLLPIERVEMVN